MHRRPLLRMQTDEFQKAAVTEFNGRLRQDLALIDADTSFTFHCIRDMRIAEHGERGDSQFDIYHGAGHSVGAHSKSYRATDGIWTLGGAGYARDPEEQAPWVKCLMDMIDTYGEILTTMLYKRWRPEILGLEEKAKADKTTAGERMRTWLNMVRHCITAWIVSTCARPRDRFGYIMTDLRTKGDIVAHELQSHMNEIYDTDEYEEMSKHCREYEDREIAGGDLAQRGGSERRTRADIAALGRQVADQGVCITTAAATQASTAIMTAASSVAHTVLAAANRQQHTMCAECKKPPFMSNCNSACREPSGEDALPTMWEGGSCACRTAMSSRNSRCREMADALDRGEGDTFMRLWHEWGEDGAITHIACTDNAGSMWCVLRSHAPLSHLTCT
jgi:hypothetical protein